MGKYKANAIQTDLDKFRHNQIYPGIIQAYSGMISKIFLRYPDIFKNVVYPDAWHIQNQKHIQNPCIFTTPVYSEPCYIQKTGIFKLQGMLRTLSKYLR